MKMNNNILALLVNFGVSCLAGDLEIEQKVIDVPEQTIT